ncbi:hypothetical protein B296_00026356 [Ensete ventricosum]|uniref:Uncharacterized protein n=1 Tax=Ensete ventricosum TaxID=4639 RepID=A0A426ZRW9_ENSVE|nr:hypothetical protein B296_00026356 [Ensete ventricosum]
MVEINCYRLVSGGNEAKHPHIVQYKVTSRVLPDSRRSMYRFAGGLVRTAHIGWYDAKRQTISLDDISPRPPLFLVASDEEKVTRRRPRQRSHCLMKFSSSTTPSQGSLAADISLFLAAARLRLPDSERQRKTTPAPACICGYHNKSLPHLRCKEPIRAIIQWTMQVLDRKDSRVCTTIKKKDRTGELHGIPHHEASAGGGPREDRVEGGVINELIGLGEEGRDGGRLKRFERPGDPLPAATSAIWPQGGRSCSGRVGQGGNRRGSRREARRFTRWFHLRPQSRESGGVGSRAALEIHQWRTEKVNQARRGANGGERDSLAAFASSTYIVMRLMQSSYGPLGSRHVIATNRRSTRDPVTAWDPFFRRRRADVFWNRRYYVAEKEAIPWRCERRRRRQFVVP